MRFLITTAIISIVLFQNSLFAQNEELFQDSTKKRANDMIIINILTDNLLNTPEGMKIMPVSVGSEIYYMSPIIGKSKDFSLALGIGLGVNNFHNNCMPYDSLDVTYFKQIPGDYEYIKNKISVAYLDIPFEIRYRTKPNLKYRNFKISLGGKVGYMISNYLKYKGEDFRAGTNKIVKFKEYNLDNFESIRYSAFLRVGYGKMNVIVNYTLSSLFKKNKGPDVVPISLGISLTLL